MKTTLAKPKSNNTQRIVCHSIWCFISVFFLFACSSTNNRYSIKHDRAPDFDYGVIKYEFVTPKHEPYNVWTSKPYKVLGNYYTPLIEAKGFEDIGTSSWYGQKFHGHTTANGETFDMFALTAAHTTLPLPSFLRVTNLDNGKRIIVRVNDRGPFHSDRILDLSYGAAKKLDFHSKGVAKVKIEVVHVSPEGDITVGRQATQKQALSSFIAASRKEFDNLSMSNNGELLTSQTSPLTSDVSDVKSLATELSITQVADTQVETQTKNSNEYKVSLDNEVNNDDLHGSQKANESVSVNPSLFVQVLALQNGEKVKSLALGIANLLQVPTRAPKIEDMYRLQIGPVENQQKANNLIEELKKIGFDKAFTIELMP